LENVRKRISERVDEMKKNDLESITKDMWIEYKNQQEDGRYNMLDPRARAMTDISKYDWRFITKNYENLMEKYDG
tara:strand:+ start:326 stop:550 length:225 start_codon:yes stop_codon:yes gene_type:complete